MTALSLLTDALAVYRLTRLATADTILDGPRDAIVRWAYAQADSTRYEQVRERLIEEADDPTAPKPIPPAAWADFAVRDDWAPKLATLVTCRWCSGAWLALLVVVARRVAPRWWGPVAEGLAFSVLAALVAGLED